jgi:oxygen-dependent protoporphyrinogen oxidase
LFRPTVTRSAGEPEEISAGAGLGYFHLVWNRGEGLSRNIVGGPSELTEAIAAGLGSRVVRRATVREVILHENHVEVTYQGDARERTLLARQVVMATAAPVTREVVQNLPDDLGAALARIVYGPYVSAAFLTNEAGPAPWDDCYAIASPKRSFNVVFNMSSVIRAGERQRTPGSSIMVFSPARLARALIDRDDAEVIGTYLRDLEEIFPAFGSLVIEARVQRWPLGLAYCFPGRGQLQSVLLRPRKRLALSGDYLGTLYTETAVQTGRRAGRQALGALAA